MRSSCVLILLCLMGAACDDNKSTSPTPAPAPAPAPAPTPTPPPPAPTPTTATLSGVTKNSNGQLIGFVTVRILDGPDQGRTSVSDSLTGAYRFEGLTAGNYNFSATGDGFLEDKRNINLVNGNNTQDFSLGFAPPPSVEIRAQPLNVTPGFSSEWGFEATASIPISRYDWDFGDGGAVSNGRSTEAHVYLAQGVYQVRVRAVPTNGSTPLIGTLNITVTF
jgi:PKD repeat protein